jgi:hypothetical protein
MGRTAGSFSYHEVAGEVDLTDAALDHRYEARWSAFLASWKFGLILAAACVAGVVFILGSHPFASASVSQRVSDKVGEPSLCTEVGAGRVGDVQETLYRCTVGLHARSTSRCFAISGSQIKQFSSAGRRLGC